MSISPRSLATMTRRLSDLVGGGLTVGKSLSVLSAQSESREVRLLVSTLRKDLGDGKSLSEALRSRNGTFGPVYTGLVRAGESSGNMEATLAELANLLESDVETRQRVRAALAYPAALLALALAVCVFLTIFVIPRFELLFQDLGQRLPWPTRFLIGVTSHFKTFGGATLLGVAVLMKGTRFRVARRPVIDGVIRSVALQRWTQVMASLLRGGVTAPDALRLSRQTLNARVFGNAADDALARLREGRSLSSALAAARFFPPMLCELVNAGEESGRLDATFERLAQAYKREAELKIKIAISLLEPALVLGMGVVVGFVAVAMLLPIFEMSANIR